MYTFCCSNQDYCEAEEAQNAFFQCRFFFKTWKVKLFTHKCVTYHKNTEMRSKMITVNDNNIHTTNNLFFLPCVTLSDWGKAHLQQMCMYACTTLTHIQCATCSICYTYHISIIEANMTMLCVCTDGGSYTVVGNCE